MSIRDSFNYLRNVFNVAGWATKEEKIPMVEIQGANEAGDQVSGLRINNGAATVEVTGSLVEEEPGNPVPDKAVMIGGKDASGNLQVPKIDSLNNLLVNMGGNNVELASNVVVPAQTSYTTNIIVSPNSVIDIAVFLNITGGPWTLDIEYLSDSGITLGRVNGIISSSSISAMLRYRLMFSRFRLIFNLLHTSNRTITSLTVSTFTANNEDRNILLANASGFQVAINTATYLTASDWTFRRCEMSGDYFKLDAYLYTYIVIRTDADHNFIAELGHAYPSGSFGTSTGPATPYVWKTASELTRKISEWLEVVSNLSRVRIDNNDAANAHTYDIALFGVR